MPEDVGALFGGMAKSGGRAFESARDYRLLTAQAAFQNALKQQEADIAEKDADLQRRINEQTLQEAKDREERTKALEKDIDTAAEAMAPKPSVAGTGVKAIKAGKKVSLPGIERLGKERAGQRAKTRIGLRKAPGQVLFPKEETAGGTDEFRAEILRSPGQYNQNMVDWAMGKKEAKDETIQMIKIYGSLFSDFKEYEGRAKLLDVEGAGEGVLTFPEYLQEIFGAAGMMPGGTGGLAKEDENLLR